MNWKAWQRKLGAARPLRWEYEIVRQELVEGFQEWELEAPMRKIAVALAIVSAVLLGTVSVYAQCGSSYDWCCKKTASGATQMSMC